jgi:maltokinase
VPQVDDLATNLTPLLAEFLPRQRWFADGTAPQRVAITSLELHRKEPLLLWILVDVTSTDGDTATYQMVVGGRPITAQPYFLQGKERVTLGTLDDQLFYDALVDPELALDVLATVAPNETAEMARPLVVEQSNSSVVYDERLILKLFRRLHAEPNPDVEVNRVLSEQGFPHVVPQRAELRRDGVDLAVVRDYLLASTDAWQLAHTSLRDLLASRLPPHEAGGDFGPEAAMLGEVTARLHAALAEAFGTFPAQPEAWLADMQAQIARSATPNLDIAQISAVLARLIAVDDPGMAIRLHGDLHLGQFLMADAGWFVLDFEGEPIRPVSERVRPSSPLRDVAGMTRSFHYASQAVLVERGRDVDPELSELAAGWEARAIDAFWHGYRRSDAADERLLPASEADQRSLLAAFELDKAVYEVAYERAHRPNWVDIPASAISRILGQGA